MTIENKIAQEQQVALLKEINNKIDLLDGKFDQMQADSKKAGAIAGAVAGGLSGGLVATGIALLKAKLGIY